MTFSDDFEVLLSRFSIVLSRSAFIFLAIVCFPELLHTQGLHKFVGSISGVVSMNTACILIGLCAINAKTLKDCVDTNYLLLECLEC